MATLQDASRKMELEQEGVFNILFLCIKDLSSLYSRSRGSSWGRDDLAGCRAVVRPPLRQRSIALSSWYASQTQRLPTHRATLWIYQTHIPSPFCLELHRIAPHGWNIATLLHGREFAESPVPFMTTLQNMKNEDKAYNAYSTASTNV